MATTDQLIQQLKSDKVIQAIPKLEKIVKQLEINQRKSEKISKQNCDLISLMADGLEYDEAYKLSRKK